VKGRKQGREGREGREGGRRRRRRRRRRFGVNLIPVMSYYLGR